MGENRKELFRLVSKFSTIGLEMGFSVVIGLLIGIYLDRYFKTEPWMTIVFLLFGVTAAFRVIIRVAKESQQEDDGLIKK
ncbi:MAG: AtpZ/AtpI family protein [Deltaproteobacteria bacterium]|nr:AtpZ/AtpI family protein [Deltaproteobacteria bacterium]